MLIQIDLWFVNSERHEKNCLDLMYRLICHLSIACYPLVSPESCLDFLLCYFAYNEYFFSAPTICSVCPFLFSRPSHSGRPLPVTCLTCIKGHSLCICSLSAFPLKILFFFCIALQQILSPPIWLNQYVCVCLFVLALLEVLLPAGYHG